MKIKDISISGFHNIADTKTYELQNMNVITGDNGKGKTTILQAIQWLLLGYIPGTNKIKGDILKHSNRDDMGVSVTFDDNSMVSRRLYQTGAKFDIINDDNIPKDFNVLGDLELPIMNYDEFIGLSANKLKSWFTSILPEYTLKIDWERELNSVIPENLSIKSDTDSLRDSIFEMLSFEVDKEKPAKIDDIKKVNDAIKEHLKMYKSELSQLESTIKTLIFYSDLTSDVELSGVTEEIKKTEDTLSKVQQNKEIKEALLAIHIDSDEGDIQKNIEELAEELSKIGDEGTQYRDRIALKQVELNNIKDIIDSKGSCPFTKESCDIISSNLTSIEPQYALLSGELEVLNNKITDTREKYKSVNQQLSAAKSKLSNLQTQLSQKAYLEGKLLDGFDDLDVDILKQKLSELSDTQMKLLANQKYEKSIDDFNKKKAELSRNIDICKLWDKHTDVNGLQSKLMVEGDQFDTLSCTMDSTKLLSDKVKFDAKGKFSYGVIREGTFIEYNQLSSGEKCMFTITLLISLLKLSDIPLKLLMIDDMLDHLDDNNLSKLSEYMKTENDVQIIFAGVFDIHPFEGINAIKL